MRNTTRFNYRHPVFYSRKHPAYASLSEDLRAELVKNLHPSEAPF